VLVFSLQRRADDGDMSVTISGDDQPHGKRLKTDDEKQYYCTSCRVSIKNGAVSIAVKRGNSCD